jgi:hypothetical protein
MWQHRCEAEQTAMLVGGGEPCTWCGETEGFAHQLHGSGRQATTHDSDMSTREADAVSA